MEIQGDVFRSGPAAAQALTPGGPVRPGDHVRLQPTAGGDIFDMALRNRMAVVDAIEQDLENRLYIAVVVDDDPGKDLGQMRKPGHRFFFRPEEVQPLGPDDPVTT